MSTWEFIANLLFSFCKILSKVTVISIILRNLNFKCKAPNCISASISQISEHRASGRSTLPLKVNWRFCLVHSSNTIMISF